MAAKKKTQENPFDTYEFDFDDKVAYRYPAGWSQKEKAQYGRLSREIKRDGCYPGGGTYTYNGLDLKIKLIKPTILEVAVKKRSKPASSEE